MPIDLSNQQWGAVDAGEVTSPEGTSFRRRSSKLARGRAAELLGGGAPILAYDFSGGVLDWYPSEEAAAFWASVWREFISSDPHPKPKAPPQWTGGRWEAEAGELLLVLTAHC